MRLIPLFLLLAVALFLPLAVNAQCCCSGAEITISDGGGTALPADEVKLSPIPNRRNNATIRISEPDSNEAKFQFYVGCGDGEEALKVEYMGVAMRVRFKLYGDFGRPKVSLAFSPADYVAEFSKERDDDGIREKVVFRFARAEEMKEIERSPASDAAPDQTANAS